MTRQTQCRGRLSRDGALLRALMTAGARKVEIHMSLVRKRESLVGHPAFTRADQGVRASINAIRRNENNRFTRSLAPTDSALAVRKTDATSFFLGLQLDDQFSSRIRKIRTNAELRNN